MGKRAFFFLNAGIINKINKVVFLQFVLDDYRRSMEMDCHAVKLWTLVTATVSQLLLTLNSSLNFAIYCLMSTDFRRILSDWTKTQLKNFFGSAFCMQG